MYWNAAYVRSSKINFATDLGKVSVGGRRLNTIRPSRFNGLLYHAASLFRLVISSPTVRGWTGIWGSTTAFQMRLFRASKYSGLILEMIDDKNYNLWSYQVWENGLPIDWFVSEPDAYFREWRKSGLQDLLIPYLAAHTWQEVRTEDPHRLLHSSYDLFKGDAPMLTKQQLLKQGTPNLRGPISDSFAHTAKGIEDFIALLDIPYMSLQYDPEEIGIYLDVETGRMDLERYRDFDDIYQAIKSLRDINRLSWMLLDIDEQDEEKLLYV